MSRVPHAGHRAERSRRRCARRRSAGAGSTTVLDLLLLVPTRYRRVPAPTPRAGLAPGAVGVGRRERSCPRASARQRRGGSFLDLSIDVEGPLRACFYNRGWLKDKVARGDRVLVTGRVSRGRDEAERRRSLGRRVRRAPRGSPAARAPGRTPRCRRWRKGRSGGSCGRRSISSAPEPDPLPDAVRARFGLEPLHASLRRIHEPCADDDLEPAAARLVFDRLLSQALIARAASAAASGPAPALAASPAVRARIRERIPFPLTPGQDAALDEILADLEKPVAMRRLLLGDVGSGKTAVAAGALLAAIAAGHQGLLVAPTDALAAQHHATLSAWLRGSRRPPRAPVGPAVPAEAARPSGARSRAGRRRPRDRDARGAGRGRRVPAARARRLRRAAPVRRAAAHLGQEQGEAAAPPRAQRDADPALALPRALRRARDHAARGPARRVSDSDDARRRRRRGVRGAPRGGRARRARVRRVSVDRRREPAGRRARGAGARAPRRAARGAAGRLPARRPSGRAAGRGPRGVPAAATCRSSSRP